MALTTKLPIQRSGVFGAIDARFFRVGWSILTALCIPLLGAITTMVLARTEV